MSTFRDDDNWDSCDDDGDDDGGGDDDDGDDDDRDSCDDDREDFDLGASDLIKLSCLLCHSWGRKSISYHFDKKNISNVIIDSQNCTTYNLEQPQPSANKILKVCTWEGDPVSIVG